MDWRKFIKKLQALGYDGGTDNLDEVLVWLKENGHDDKTLVAKGKNLSIRELWENRPGQTLDVSDAADEAEYESDIQKKAEELLAERERAGLIQRRRNGNGEHPHQIVTKVRDRLEDDPCLGYRKFNELGYGQWLQDVAKHAICLKEGRMDDRPQRLMKAQQILTKAAPGLQEAIDGEGGFLAPTEHRAELLKRIYETGRVFPRARQVAMSSRTMDVPYIVETSRATGSRHGGVRGYWVAEAGSITDSKPAFGLLNLKAHKLACLGYATTEIEEDSSVGALQLLSELFAEELAWLMDDSFINGTGAGQPLGIMNSPCLISVTRGGSGTIVHASAVIGMWARLYAPSRPNAVWFISQDLMPDLALLSAQTQAGTSELSYFLPQVAGVGSPIATLFGRPVIEIEQCAVRGDPGDIILADMTQYLHGMRSGIQTAQSIHVQFLTDQTAFRATVRLDGQPWWQAALTPTNAGATLSPFLTLATS